MTSDSEDAVAALEARVLELEQSLEAHRRLTSGALHDLKAPARGIAQLSAWIAEELEGQVDEEVASWLVLLRQRGTRMQELVQDLLSYVLSEVREPDLVAVSTRELVQEVWVDINAPRYLELMIPGSMPILVADHLALRQVFANLLENAIKYHDDSAGVIVVQARDLGEEYEVLVTDDGPGIASEQLERVFDPFFRVSGNSVEGSGLGLALVAQVVRAAGGRIRVESKLGDGATFRFTWPKRGLG